MQSPSNLLSKTLSQSSCLSCDRQAQPSSFPNKWSTRLGSCGPFGAEAVKLNIKGGKSPGPNLFSLLVGTGMPRRSNRHPVPVPCTFSHRKGADIVREERSYAITTRFDIRIIKLLQNRDNGGLCPFSWQEFTVFMRSDLAGSCQPSNLFIQKV